MAKSACAVKRTTNEGPKHGFSKKREEKSMRPGRRERKKTGSAVREGEPQGLKEKLHHASNEKKQRGEKGKMLVRMALIRTKARKE